MHPSRPFKRGIFMGALAKKARPDQSLSVVPPAFSAGPLVGRIASVDLEGPFVHVPGQKGPPVRARTTLALEATQWARAVGQEALLVFEQLDLGLPIVVGLIEPVRRPPVDALVDGRRISLEATDEIVLRCGKASLTLRRNGRVVIRGAYVESESTGVNRVKGGCVKLN